MFAVLEDLDAVPRVTGRVRRHEHGFDAVVFDQFFHGGGGLAAADGLGQAGAAIGDEIADGYDLHIWVVLEAEGGAELTHAVPDQTDSNSAVRDRLPTFGGVR